MAILNTKQCRAWAKSTNSRCTKNIRWSSKYCWHHQDKRPIVIAIVITFVIGIITSFFIPKSWEHYFPSKEIKNIDKKLDRIPEEFWKLGEEYRKSWDQSLQELLSSNDLSRDEAQSLGDLAFYKYKDTEYFDALKHINQVIENRKTGYGAYLIRAYIYDALYKKFQRINRLDKKQIYPEKWYRLAVKDYEKAILLSAQKEVEKFYIDASGRLAMLYGLKAFEIAGPGKQKNPASEKLYAKSQQIIDELLKQFPENRQVKEAKQLIDFYINYEPIEIY
ncbi:MAG: hypothetical protein KAT52_06445 [Desulfobacterales bacterium]|nr:hypothetical protein [Desulfobacterales bacterium]